MCIRDRYRVIEKEGHPENGHKTTENRDFDIIQSMYASYDKVQFIWTLYLNPENKINS